MTIVVKFNLLMLVIKKNILNWKKDLSEQIKFDNTRDYKWLKKAGY